MRRNWTRRASLIGLAAAALLAAACASPLPTAGVPREASEASDARSEEGEGPAPGSEATPLAQVSVDEVPAQDIRDWVEVNRPYGHFHFFTFGAVRYLLVGRGESPDAAHGLEVKELTLDPDGTVHVRLRWTSPGSEAVTLPAVSYPVVLLATPASAKAYDIAYEGEGAPPSPGLVEPNIVVTRPAPGETLAGRVELQGRARAFEGTVQVSLEDGHHVLLQTTLQGVGAPEWMDLDASLEYDPPTNDSGMLSVYVLSARDGSKQDVVMIPVRFGR